MIALGCNPHTTNLTVSERSTTSSEDGRITKSRKITKVDKTITTQRVYSFQGLFDSTYKPDAQSFHIQLEDIISLVNEGQSIHGEWYLKQKRLPKKGGHSLPLPPELEEWDGPPIPLTDKKIAHLSLFTDGCAAQFAGRKNFGRLAELKKSTQVDISHTILVANHGKNICDGLSNVATKTLNRAVTTDELVFPGPREQVWSSCLIPSSLSCSGYLLGAEEESAYC